MATQAHCAFCFETLTAQFESRRPLRLKELEALWYQYASTRTDDKDDNDENDNEDDNEATMTDAEEEPAKPAAISRLLNRGLGRNTRSAASSSSSLPSTQSGSSGQSTSSSGLTTPASSRSSLLSPTRKQAVVREEHPLFVTWNTHSHSGHKSLRGCIGTFQAQELEDGLQTYALTSALEDTRFSPITASELPKLSNHVTLLTNFSEPVRDPLDWTLGTHGIRISFTYRGRKLGATYLPDVAKEQGWTKDETLVSLMRKAGWNGSSSGWAKTWRDGSGKLVRYEGKQVGMEYAEWRRFREWINKQDDTQ